MFNMVFYFVTMAACTSSMSMHVQLGNVGLVSWTMVPRGSLIVSKFPKIMHEFHPNIIHYLIKNTGMDKLMPIFLIHVMIQTNDVPGWHNKRGVFSSEDQ